MVTAKELPRNVDARIRLPDIPERKPDEVPTYDSLHHDGNAFHLRQHLIAQRADPERLWSRPIIGSCETPKTSCAAGAIPT